MRKPTEKNGLTAPGTGSSARAEERLDSIRQAVLELVAAHGIEGVTIDAIAAAAKASKATMYRRWPTKSALIADAIEMSFGTVSPGDPGDLGSLRAELRSVVDGAANMLRQDRRLIIALIDGAQRDETIRTLMRRQTQDNFREALQKPLQRGIARGEITPSTNLNVIQEVALPVLLHRAIWNDPIDDRFIDFLIDDLLMRLLGTPSREAPEG